MEPLKSALFIDFDNIYIRLQQQDQQLADIFARSPEKWLGWLEENAFKHGKLLGRRDVLVRKCYLNPMQFSDFRPFFIKSAFNVIDCPSLTYQGKNSADIHMVLDILDILKKNDPCYDEFIIFSGDADFTPVLIKLRESARLTTVLSVGAASVAYKAAASSIIGEDQFIDEALQMERDMAADVLDDNALYQLKNKIASFLVEYVRSQPTPTVIAKVGDELRKNFSSQITDDWLGEGRLKDFLSSLDLDGLELSFKIPGYIYDPKKHSLPEEEKKSLFATNRPDIYALAERVHQLTDTPLLSPETYACLFKVLAAEVNANGYFLTETSKRLRDRCVAEGVPISRQHANFVLVGLNKVKFIFDQDGNNSAEALAKAFAHNVYSLCTSAQMELDEKRRKLFFRWLLSKE